MLNEAERERIAAAVAEVETKTRGEIVCVLAKEVSTYPEIPILAAAIVALLAPPLLLAAGLPLFAAAEGDWTAGHAGHLGTALGAAVGIYALAQAALFAIALPILSFPAIRRVLTPRRLKRQRVRDAAFAQFLGTGLHTANDRTGVVIFAAIGERQVEIVADELINKAVGEQPWRDAADAMTHAMAASDPARGFEEAVRLCGAALATHFPPAGGSENRLSNRPLEF